MRLTLEGRGERVSAWFEDQPRGCALNLVLTAGVDPFPLTRSLTRLRWKPAGGRQTDLFGETPTLSFYRPSRGRGIKRRALESVALLVSDVILCKAG